MQTQRKHATACSAGSNTNLQDQEPPALVADYEYRAQAALCRLARDRELAPRDALKLLVELGVAADVRSLAAAMLHAEQIATRMRFNTTHRRANDGDRAVLRSQLGVGQ